MFLATKFLALTLFLVRRVSTTEVAISQFANRHSSDEIFAEDLLFSENACSLVDCAGRCLFDSKCWIFTYFTSGPVSSCRGHTSWRMTSNSTAMPGAVAYTVSRPWLDTVCSGNYDCPAECFAGKCLCTPGYYFSLSKHTCMAECPASNLQPSYLEYPYRYIQNNNLYVHHHITSPQQCLDTCSADPQCLTVDITDDAPTYSCRFQGVTALDVGVLPAGKTIHYQKTCV